MYEYVCVFVYMCVTKFIRNMNLKARKEGNIEGFRGRKVKGNDLIISYCTIMI